MIYSIFGDKYSSNKLKAKVELYDGSTLVETCTCSRVDNVGNGAGALSHFSVSREGELGKFFGFGVSHKLEMTLIDLEKVLKIYEGNTAKVCFGDGTLFDAPFPRMDITSVKIDKKTGDITVTANDPLYFLAQYTFNDIKDEIGDMYTPAIIARACARLLGLDSYTAEMGVVGSTAVDASLLNFDGTENLREVLNRVAEVTQTIYYVESHNDAYSITEEDNLKFVKLGTESVAEYHRQDYYEFEVETPKTITGICSASELGDNVETPKGDGVTQYVRDNPLWELREDIDTLLEDAIANIGGLTLQQFDLDWSGDYRLEVGDCFTVYYDDDATKLHLLNDVIEYAGTMSQKTSWSYQVTDQETPTNPTTIGDKINQTFARVDKVNREIELVASKAEENATNIANLTLTTDEIVIKVEETSKKIEALDETGLTDLVETVDIHTVQLGMLQVKSDEVVSKVSALEETIDENGEVVNSLANEVALKLDKEGVVITVEEMLSDGVEKVVTAAKKYTFDDTGLNVDSTENNISTTITEDGMRVKRAGQEVLIANNEGVKAEDLHATTFLLIGENSRFQDWNDSSVERTACFWIGG